MFSRVSKSIVTSFGSRQIHIGDKNFKITLIGGVGEIGQSLSQLLKDSVKLNVLALYNVATVNKTLPDYNRISNFHDDQLIKSIPSGVLMMGKKSCSAEVSRTNTAINNGRKRDNNINFNLINREEDNRRNEIEKLVEALFRLPIAEKTSALNSPLIPIDEVIPKAGNACGRMSPYARVLGEMGPSCIKICQRGYTTVAIRKLPDSMHPPFQERKVNVITGGKVPKKYRSRKKETNDLSRSVPIVKEYDRESASLLNRDKNPVKGPTKRLRDVDVLPNKEMYRGAAGNSINWMIADLLNDKSRLSRQIRNICNKFVLPFSNSINCKYENDRAVVVSSRNSETMTDDALSTVEEENWIQRMFSKIESILPDLRVKIRPRSTITLDARCSDIFAANEMISVSDVSSDRTILLASKDWEPISNIRKKIQAYCAQRKKSLGKRTDEDVICKRREKVCNMTERDKICGRNRVGCSERKERTVERQLVSCEGRKSSCDKRNDRDRKIPKVESQPDLCKQRKDVVSKTKEDLCKGQRRVEQKQTCKQQEKVPSKQEKKEEIKKSDCSDIKKVKPREKKDCPTVKKAPGCSENNGKKQN